MATERIEFKVLLRGVRLDDAARERIASAIQQAVLSEWSHLNAHGPIRVRPLSMGDATRLPEALRPILGFFLEGT